MTSSVRRVAILGAESTGKSTLSAALATRHRTLWVPEYLREFVDRQQRTPFEHEQIEIASRQVEWENAASRSASGLLFCDTTPVMTALYSLYYWGRVDPRLDAMARRRHYHATIVTAPDTPWVPDGLQRESAQVRQHLHEQLIALLGTLEVPYLLVTGDLEQRLEQADTALGIPVRSRIAR